MTASMLMERIGGPERCLVEATPTRDMAHLRGYPLLMYARERRTAENNPGLYSPPDLHPKITVILTGHGRTGFTEDRRDALSWLRQGMDIGWMTHEASKLWIGVQEGAQQ